MKNHHPITRGFGIFETLLASLRARCANRLIPHELRTGRILDIGCGSYPYFLAHIDFESKFGIELRGQSQFVSGIQLFTLDVNRKPRLPFPDGHFKVITMLAVIEHLDPDGVVMLFKECYRAMAPGGRIIITTPASWTSQLLKGMAKLRLVSKEEIDDHVYTYSHPIIAWLFGKANFDRDRIRFGYFELFMNIYAFAEK